MKRRGGAGQAGHPVGTSAAAAAPSGAAGHRPRPKRVKRARLARHPVRVRLLATRRAAAGRPGARSCFVWACGNFVMGWAPGGFPHSSATMSLSIADSQNI